jgi:hypothetical protein
MLKTQIKTTDSAKKLQIISDHVPVSVSIFSNVPDYDDKPTFLCNDKSDILIHELIQNVLKVALNAKSINEIKHNLIITFLDAYVKTIPLKKLFHICH